jgi:hypothetical protein
MTIADAIYLLCALTSLAAAALLLRHYRAVRSPLLLWSCIGFAGLAFNNVLLFVDLAVLPHTVNLAVPRTVVGMLAMVALIYGLIWEAGA